MAQIFSSFPDKPDHNRLELEILERWERENTFEKLRELNRGGQRFSFVDGPITANNPMGVHHAWGRTLKDVFQRYKALRGFDQRYQNGFDCQGLWVEVEVERALGLNSKRDIEEYGLAEFAERCKERVAKFSEVITEQSRRLGMWMDWDADYYTFTDTNIEYIWRFLKAVHEREWLYQGHRSTVWCPRCGTSISQHELFAGEYRELEHPSLFVRFPLKGRDGESLAVWTTTPWTLPANVAAAVNPTADYGLRESGEWVATALHPDEAFVRSALGAELVGLEYEGPFDHLPAQQGVVHRVIPWDDVALDEGTGIVHIAPGAGAEDFELSRVHDLPVLAPLDEAGRMLPGYGFDALSSDEVAEPVIHDLRHRGLLIDSGRIVHRYPTCWRCGTPLVFRIVDDWFISAEEIRQPMLDANATVEWTPAFYSKRMDDWLRNMGDWNISRKRYFGLPLPFYPCDDCETLTVIGSRSELEERALSGARATPGAPPAMDRRGRDRLLRLREAGAARSGSRRRVARRGDRPALDAWLAEPRVPPAGVCNRRRGGLDDGGPSGPRVLGAVVPGQLGLGDARADPALVLLAVLHVGDADRRLAVSARSHVREAPRRDRARDAPVVGERDRSGRGVRPHGRGRDALAVQRAASQPEPLVRLRPRARDPAAPPDALELGEVPRRLREHRRVEPDLGRPRERPGRRPSAARSLARRTDGRARRGRDGRIRAGWRRTSSALSTCSSRTCRTGTSGGLGGASGTATKWRCGPSGTPSRRGFA